MCRKYPPRNGPLQFGIKAIHKLLHLLNIAKPAARQQPDLIDPHQPARTMSCHIPIIGVVELEKLAEGRCPCCQSKIELWLSPEGVEISRNLQSGRPSR